jgi:serine/threonine-protein kinase
VILTLLAIFASSGAGWWFASGPGGLALVPELEGRSLEVAISALEPMGLKVIEQEEHDAQVPVGLVIRTEPTAGTSVFKQSEVTVFISLGPKQVLVPESLGLDLEQATELLESTGLIVGNVSSFFGLAEAGQVLEFSKPTGTSLAEGSVVDLRVSLGPLPDVVAEDFSQATQTLEALGLTVTSLEVFNDDVPAGRVVSITASSDPLPESGSVTLNVSKGPEFMTLPNVVGETVAAAKNELESLGFTVLVDTDQLSSRFGVVKVTRQNPAASSRVRVGTQVTIFTR